jgi:hypothetical protein
MTAPRQGIHTPSELRRSARRLDCRAARVNAVLALLRQGEALLLKYESGRPHWSLSSGRSISAEVASVLINCVSVVPAGDALFDDTSQTWVFAH